MGNAPPGANGESPAWYELGTPVLTWAGKVYSSTIKADSFALSLSNGRVQQFSSLRIGET
jgi:hypothetical protein